jgi:hypothetical protein
MSGDESVIPKSWLQRRRTVEEVESESAHDGVPFGCMNEKWSAIRLKMIDGDKIWEFCSSPESWQHLAGRAGFALVRRGIAVDCIVTVLN